MSEKNNLDKYTGILFELKIGLNKDNAIVIDYGGKPVAKIREALKDTISTIVDGIRQTLEKTPPELSSDIMDLGITLSGGGALLKGLDKHIQDETNIVTRIAEDPLKCVALGTGKALDEIEVFKKALITD